VVTSGEKELCAAYITKAYPKATHSRACRLLDCSRKKIYYEKKMPSKDEPLRKAIAEVIGNSRKGRIKVIKLVQKSNPEMGSSRIRRVYEKEGFSLQKRLRRRMKDNPSNPLQIPLHKNEEWAMDFMSDSLVNGNRIRTLNVIDHYNRECKGIKVARNIPARVLIAILEIIIEKHGKPKRIRTDNGPEFRSKLFQLWLKANGIEWSKIQKGKPQQNAIVERFNRTYREDILDANVFVSPEDAQELTDSWIEDYNNNRPHQSLNYQTPSFYAA
jgi:Transposase and inactivated derivatives